MTSSLFCLLALALICRLSLHEKGKKRAKRGKYLIPGSLILGAFCHLVAVVQAQFERMFGAIAVRRPKARFRGGDFSRQDSTAECSPAGELGIRAHAKSVMPLADPSDRQSAAVLVGTHHGASREQLQVYLDEFVFRHNRRRLPMAAFQTLLGFGAARKPTAYKQIRGGC